MDTLYYDGKCLRCARAARRLLRLSDPDLQLQDLHRVADHSGQPAKLLKLTSLHLQNSQGEWLTGIDAVIHAWSHTSWGWLFSTLRWPLLHPLARTSYQWYSRRRYQRLYGCPECTDPEEDR